MRDFVIGAITVYQRYLSPHKGFCCAYHHHTGRPSCSELGLRAVRRYGVLAGFAVLRERLYRCGVAHRRYAAALRRPHRRQRGDCDIGCDAPCDMNCDFPGGKSCEWAGNAANCCDCGSCDWPNRKDKRNDQEPYVHLPPKVTTTRGRLSCQRE